MGHDPGARVLPRTTIRGPAFAAARSYLCHPRAKLHETSALPPITESLIALLTVEEFDSHAQYGNTTDAAPTPRRFGRSLKQFARLRQRRPASTSELELK